MIQFGHAEFELPRRHLHEANEEAVKYMGLEFREKNRAGKTHLGVISI